MAQLPAQAGRDHNSEFLRHFAALDSCYINIQRFVTGPTAMTRHETVGQSRTFAVKGAY